MEQARNRDSQSKGQTVGQENQKHRQNGKPEGLDGMNFEEQRGSLKNSDYGGAIVNTESGRNSSDVKQEEIKRAGR